MARRLFNRTPSVDLASLTPMGVPGAAKLTGMSVPDTSQVPAVFGEPAQIQTDRATELYEAPAYPATLVPMDRRRFLRKRTGDHGEYLQYADPVVTHAALAYGDIGYAVDEATFDQDEHEVKFQDVDDRRLVHPFSYPLAPLLSAESVYMHYENYAEDSPKTTIPDRAGVATDPGHSPLDWVFFDYQRPFDQLASQRLQGTKGVFGVPEVGQPKMTVMEAVGKMPAPGMTGFGTQAPTERDAPDIWYQEEATYGHVHSRTRKRF